MDGTPREAPHVKARSYVIIPARLASTRLPEKMLLDETGLPLIQHTYQAACRANLPSKVIIACDDRRIEQAVQRFGGEVVMTDPSAPSGTDRVAEVAAKMEDAEIIVNLQGDEPEVPPEAIDQAIQTLHANPEAVMSTLATPIRERNQLEDPACVKVVFDRQHRAMYFSRSPIPHPREWSDDLLNRQSPLFYQHIGLYAYRRAFLLDYPQMPRAAIETTENLEQLRALHHGHTIAVTVIETPLHGIDTPEDYRDFVRRWRGRK